MGLGRSIDRTEIWTIPVQEFTSHRFNDHVFKFISIEFHINSRRRELSVSTYPEVTFNFKKIYKTNSFWHF